MRVTTVPATCYDIQLPRSVVSYISVCNTVNLRLHCSYNKMQIFFGIVSALVGIVSVLVACLFVVSAVRFAPLYRGRQ